MGRQSGHHAEASGRSFSNERYVLLEQIGRGAAADVYLARDTQLGREVAIKMLTEETAADPAFVERFHREAQAIASLSHPNVVRVYDWGSSSGTDFMVMEYVSGGPLTQRMKSFGRLDEREALDIAAGVARALVAAHDRGIVHRDIKPDNVLLSEGHVPKVADFGIARAQGVSNLTATNVIFGTVSYISPEQARGTSLDGRSDLYSLGVVLFEMLSGRVPFPGTSMVDVAVKHVQTPPPPLRALRPGVSPATARVVERALAKAPRDRFPDARAMLRALEDASASLEDLAIERVTVRSPLPRPVPAAAYQSRRPLLAIILALIALAGGGVVAAHTLAIGSDSPSVAGGRHPAVPTGVSQKPTAPTSRRGAAPSSTHAPATSPPTTAAPTPQPRVTSAGSGTNRPAGAPPGPGATRPAGAAPTSSSPTATVIHFYEDVGRHNFAAAAALWSPSLRRADPPAVYIDRRFANTRFIWVDRVSIIQQDSEGQTSTVSAHVRETLANGTGQEFTGSWKLIRSQGTWLLDQPNLRQVKSEAPPPTQGTSGHQEKPAKLSDGHKKADDHGHHGKGQNNNGGE